MLNLTYFIIVYNRNPKTGARLSRKVTKILANPLAHLVKIHPIQRNQTLKTRILMLDSLSLLVDCCLMFNFCCYHILSILAFTCCFVKSIVLNLIVKNLMSPISIPRVITLPPVPRAHLV